MIEPKTIASKFYADEAVRDAIRDKKSFADMDHVIRSTPDPELRKYLIDRLREALGD